VLRWVTALLRGAPCHFSFFGHGTLVSQTLKIGVTRDNIVVPLDDDRIDKPAPTNDCEQLVALFIRVRAAFRFVRPSFLSGRISILGCQKRPPSRSLARLRRGNTMDEDSKKFSES
jgi:hypothetical protein